MVHCVLAGTSSIRSHGDTFVSTSVIMQSYRYRPDTIHEAMWMQSTSSQPGRVCQPSSVILSLLLTTAISKDANRIRTDPTTRHISTNRIGDRPASRIISTFITDPIIEALRRELSSYRRIDKTDETRDLGLTGSGAIDKLHLTNPAPERPTQQLQYRTRLVAPTA